CRRTRVSYFPDCHWHRRHALAGAPLPRRRCRFPFTLKDQSMNSSQSTLRNVAIISVAVVAIVAAAVFWKSRNGPGPAGDFVEYPMTVANDIPTTVAAAPDGTIWFTIGFADAVGMIRDGKMQRLPKGKKSVEPVGLAVD